MKNAKEFFNFQKTNTLFRVVVIKIQKNRTEFNQNPDNGHRNKTCLRKKNKKVLTNLTKNNKK